MWPFIKDDGDDDDVQIDKVPLSTLFRWFLYDMDVDNPNQYAKVFDLTAVSEEGDEKEREESDRRTEKLEPIYPYLSLFASINAQYTYESQKAELLLMPGMSEEILQKEGERIKLFYRNITFAGLMGTFSTALELGLIKLNGTFTGIE